MFNKTVFCVIFNLPKTFISTSFILNIFWKHIEKTRKALIFLKQPTKEEMWRFKDLLNRSSS